MNWYKVAENEKKPYLIYRIQGGQPDTLLNIPHINATSANQARAIALKKYPSLKVFVQGCLARNQECDIQARLDTEKWREITQYQARKKQEREEQIQDAWWNK